MLLFPVRHRTCCKDSQKSMRLQWRNRKVFLVSTSRDRQKMDCDGYYNMRPSDTAPYLTTVDADGTPGVSTICSGQEMTWLPGRAPWECCPSGLLHTLPEGLLELVGHATHPAATFDLKFAKGDRTKRISGQSPLSGAAYIRRALSGSQDAIPEILVSTRILS